MKNCISLMLYFIKQGMSKLFVTIDTYDIEVDIEQLDYYILIDILIELPSTLDRFIKFFLDKKIKPVKIIKLYELLKEEV